MLGSCPQVFLQPSLEPTTSGCVLRETIHHLTPLEKLELFDIVFVAKASELHSHVERLAQHIMLRHAAVLLAPTTPILPVLRLLCKLKDTRPSIVLQMLNTDELPFLVRLAGLPDPVSMAEASQLLEQAGLDPITHQRWFDSHHRVRPLRADPLASTVEHRFGSNAGDIPDDPANKLTSTCTVPGSSLLAMLASLATVLIVLYVWIAFFRGHGYTQ